MWKKITEKLFCTHQWKSHALNTYSRDLYNGGKEVSTNEILICQKCGKINQITY